MSDHDRTPGPNRGNEGTDEDFGVQRLREVVARSMRRSVAELPGDDEDLIDHGAHSLTVMHVVSAAAEHGIRLEEKDLWLDPTLAGWWRCVQDGRELGRDAVGSS